MKRNKSKDRVIRASVKTDRAKDNFRKGEKMLKKVFLATIIIAILFPWQLSSSEIRPQEQIIANSPDSLAGFLVKAGADIKNYVKRFPFPEKGRFETTAEYAERLQRWQLSSGISSGIIGPFYKATGLFPVKLGEYNADRETFGGFYVEMPCPEIEKVSVSLGGIYQEIGTRIMGKDACGFIMGYSFSSYLGGSFRYPREKTRILREKNLRCDIVFSLQCTKAVICGWDPNIIFCTLALELHSIKVYSPETGDVLFQTSVEK